MLDFNHVLNTPGYDIQTFMGTSGTTLIQWQTWRKPRGVKWIYMIGVGGGASGQTGINTGTTSGGGAGGSSGAQTMLMIPAMFIPDVLYIQAGLGGVGSTTSGGQNNAGTITYVSVEPNTTLTTQTTLLFANGGPAGGTVPTSTAGGVTAATAAVATIANMPLAGRGHYQFLAGLGGGTGGTSTTSGGGPGFPQTGLMVQGGCGGGGTSAGTAQGGGGSMGAAIGQTFPVTSASGSSPDGVNFQAAFYQMNYGGTGGVGASNSVDAGKGGAGSPGAGGGGGGGANTTRTAVKGGDGGPGFVIIISF
jgi:hypothetical protein